MNYWRVGQAVGVIMAGLGVGVLLSSSDGSGGDWVAMGIALFAGCRLLPWLARKDGPPTPP